MKPFNCSRLGLMVLLALLALAPPANAFNINAFTAYLHADQAPASAVDERSYSGGNVFDEGFADPAGLDLNFGLSSSLDPLTNLGTLSWTVTNTGASALTHVRFLVLLDAFIDVGNDSADATGLTLGVGRTDPQADSFEIDAPTSPPFLDHLLAGTLNNTNGFASSFGDVGMALGFVIGTLGAGEGLQATFDLNPQDNGGLRLFDQAASEQVFFNGEVPVLPAPVPEPATMILMGAGLSGLGLLQRWKRKAPR